MSKNEIDEISEQKENDAQCDGHVKVATARFHHRGCGQYARVPLDITSDHDGGAHF